jgi:hypothetical protein
MSVQSVSVSYDACGNFSVAVSNNDSCSNFVIIRPILYRTKTTLQCEMTSLKCQVIKHEDRSFFLPFLFTKRWRITFFPRKMENYLALIYSLV